MHKLAVSARPGKTYGPCRRRKQRVVRSLAYVLARVEPGAALTNNDGAGLDEFTAEGLNAEHLGVGVATILGRPHSFLMSHGTSLGVYRVRLDVRRRVHPAVS